MCTGTRGDVQPFIVSPQLEALGLNSKGPKDQHGSSISV